MDAPKTKNIKNLLNDFDNNVYGIPSFQRDFDWKKHHVKELFISIFKKNYVGSILLWDAAHPAELNPTPIFGKKVTSNFNPKYLVLDGQQRLTSIFYVLTGPKEKISSEKYSVKFFIDMLELKKALFEESIDVENPENNDSIFDKIIITINQKEFDKKSLVDIDIQFSQNLFPLFEMEKYRDWIIDYLDTFPAEHSTDKKNKRGVYLKFFEEFFIDFHIPMIELPSTMNLLSISTIFEKINRAGKPLTVFDLLNAKLGPKVHLRQKLLPKIKENLHIEKYIELEKLPVLLLQTMCLFDGTEIKRKFILELDPFTFEQRWDIILSNVGDTINKIENLRGDYGIFKLRWNPYPSMLPGLTYLMYLAKKHPNKARCMQKISCWFWAICYSGDYDSASDTKTWTDIHAIIEWFDDDVIPSFITHQNPSELEEARLVTSSNNALFKAIVCLISLNKCQDFLENDLVEMNPDLDIHHIFPKSMKNLKLKNKNHINSILNKTLISASTNRNYLNSQKPSQYIAKILKDTGISEEKLIQRFETHLISKKAYDCMKKDDFYGFIEARQETIFNEFQKRIYAFN